MSRGVLPYSEPHLAEASMIKHLLVVEGVEEGHPSLEEGEEEVVVVKAWSRVGRLEILQLGKFKHSRPYRGIRTGFQSF
jgi:hypothetical protein